MNSLLLGSMPLLMAPPPGAEGAGAGLMGFLPLIAIIAIFYFLILRPQSKKQKETQKMLQDLKKGDRVVTIGGIHGVIQSMRENTLILKVDENVKLEFNRGAIASVTSQARERDDNTSESEDK